MLLRCNQSFSHSDVQNSLFVVSYFLEVAIPNEQNIHCVDWNLQHGWIACGGEEGLVKVLKLGSNGPENSKNPTNLAMNQTLEGHGGRVNVIRWNSHFQKLTTADENGLIIVWMLHRGMWYEEMVSFPD